jgi:hypothetical protein
VPLRVAAASGHCAWRALLSFRQKPFRPVSGTFQSGRRCALHPQWLLVARQPLDVMPRLRTIDDCGLFVYSFVPQFRSSAVPSSPYKSRIEMPRVVSQPPADEQLNIAKA